MREDKNKRSAADMPQGADITFLVKSNKPHFLRCLDFQTQKGFTDYKENWNVRYHMQSYLRAIEQVY